MTANPACLILLPVYNGESFLPQTLDAVFAQDFLDFHVVAVDDASRDGSPAILEAYRQRHPAQMTVVRHPENQGITEAMRTGLSACPRTDFLAQLGQDDLWDPAYLGRQIAYLRENEALVAFSGVEAIDGSGQPAALSMFDHAALASLSPGALLLRLVEANFLCASASVIHWAQLPEEEDISQLLGYRNDRMQDYELWLHLCRRGGFGHNPAARCGYRWHGGNVSTQGVAEAEVHAHYAGMLQRVLYSQDFDAFIVAQPDPAAFCLALTEKLAGKPYIPLVSPGLLGMLAERWLLLGYGGDTLEDTLYEIYQSYGMLTHCVKNGRRLSQPVPVQIPREGSLAALEAHLEGSGNFEISYGFAAPDLRRLFLVPEDDISKALRQNSFHACFLRGRAVILCEAARAAQVEADYPGVRCLDAGEAPDRLAMQVLQYVQARTDLYFSPQVFLPSAVPAHPVQDTPVGHWARLVKRAAYRLMPKNSA